MTTVDKALESAEVARSSSIMPLIWDRLLPPKRGDDITSSARFARFKRDEAVVMQYMNDALEREQKQLERKRLLKQKQKLQAKQMASSINKRRQQYIRHHFLQEDDSSRSMTTADADESFSEEGLEVEHLPEKSDSADHDPDTINSNPKTIQWCHSVEEEMERRRIHRLTHPVRPGGIARRVRKTATPEPAILVQDGESLKDILQVVAEYRKMAGLE